MRSARLATGHHGRLLRADPVPAASPGRRWVALGLVAARLVPVRALASHGAASARRSATAADLVIGRGEAVEPIHRVARRRANVAVQQPRRPRAPSPGTVAVAAMYPRRRLMKFALMFFNFPLLPRHGNFIFITSSLKCAGALPHPYAA